MEQNSEGRAFYNSLEDRIDLVGEQGSRVGGVSIAVIASVVLHAILMFWFIRNYRPVAVAPANTPIARYVELIRSNPRDFVEAPGRSVERAPLSAPFSDANRKAASPQRTGDRPINRPGDGERIYTPAQRPAGAQPVAPQQQAAAEVAPPSPAPSSERVDSSSFVYHPPTQANAGVDWRSAIREVGKVASLGGSGEALDLGSAATGGEKGFAESGPLSFETQWYDWGEYAQSMVSRIRVNWYGNMPSLIKTGMQGVVTIRFTIQRDGRITEVVILQSSGVPPYDYAAKKAIELSSPLNPLPKDFPNANERVTAMFFYNRPVPER